MRPIFSDVLNMPLFWEITISILIALLFSPLWVLYFMALKAYNAPVFCEALREGRVVIRFTVKRGIFFTVKSNMGES